MYYLDCRKLKNGDYYEFGLSLTECQQIVESLQKTEPTSTLTKKFKMMCEMFEREQNEMINNQMNMK